MAYADASLCRACCRLFGKPFGEGRHENRHVRRRLQFEIIEILGSVEAADIALSMILRQNGHGSLSQDLPHVHFKGPVGDKFPADPQAVRPSSHLRHRPKSHTRHEFAHLLRDKKHEAGHVFRASAEAVSEFPVLCGDTDRTCVLGTDTHHHTAQAHQRSCGETEFLRSQKRRNSNVSAAHEFSVCLQDDSVAQAVLRQAPVRLREAQFPGKARIVYGASGCSAGPSVIAGDQDNLRAGLCHAGRDGSDT